MTYWRLATRCVQLALEYADNRQVAIFVVIGQAIADDEGIRDDKPTVVGLNGHDLTADLAKQDGGADRCSAAVLEALDQGAERLPRIEDVVEKEHVAAGHIG